MSVSTPERAVNCLSGARMWDASLDQALDMPAWAQAVALVGEAFAQFTEGPATVALSSPTAAWLAPLAAAAFVVACEAANPSSGSVDEHYEVLAEQPHGTPASY